MRFGNIEVNFRRTRVLRDGKPQRHGGNQDADVHVGLLRQKFETDPKNPACILTIRGLGHKFNA